MKMTSKFLAAILMCAMFASCTANADSEVITSTQEIPPETTAAAADMATPAALEETEAPTETTEPFVMEVKPVITEVQNQVTVTTPDEFLAAIGPNTEIIVDAELIDLSKATGYGTTNGDYYYWAEEFDGPELFIAEVSNLTIRGSGEDHNANVISSVPRYSDVLNFFNCSNIMVTGLTAGHTEEPGCCVGGVLFFMNCQDVLVEDCGLFGCGTWGVSAERSKNIQIINNDIYECSVGGVQFTSCNDINVDGNTFRDIGGSIFRVYGCGTITCNGEPVHDFSPRR